MARKRRQGRPKRVSTARAKRAAARRAVEKFPASYKSILYGVLTVIVLSAVVFTVFRFINPKLNRPTGQITQEAAKTQNNQAISEQQKATYVVSSGDTLWAIAEKSYKSGYYWTEIARANNLKNPDMIDVGMKLTLPRIAQKITQEIVPSTVSVTQTITPTQNAPNEVKITGNTYTVVRGDNLWNICVRAYGDGYKWVEVARVNNLSNPDLIHSGNVFKLPR